MTLFGWLFVGFWSLVIMETAKQGNPKAAIVSVMILIGLLVWGTGTGV